MQCVEGKMLLKYVYGKNKASHLLDIDGDTCHIANDFVKKFAWDFKNHLENMFDDIY